MLVLFASVLALACATTAVGCAPAAPTAAELQSEEQSAPQPDFAASPLNALGSTDGGSADGSAGPNPAVEAALGAGKATGQLTPASVRRSTDSTTFAIIGDFGDGGGDEARVASMVASWHPAYILTTGDNCYPNLDRLGTQRYDRAIGAYYGPWLKDIAPGGVFAPVGRATVNAFFPCLGNHDYTAFDPTANDYLTYFTLPGTGFANTSGNERYYDFVEGPVHYFMLNSNKQEPDGVTAESVQGQWLKTQLAASTSRFNIVIEHHPPYTSDNVHGATNYMRWPFAQWGADLVLSGHAHVYERIRFAGENYIINGMGGAKRYAFSQITAGSQVRYRAMCGAQRVTVTDTSMTFAFFNQQGRLIDRWVLSKP